MSGRPLMLSSVLALCAVAACGGKVVLDVTSGGTGGGAPGTGSVGGSSTAGGGCDAASHTIDITDFDVSCMQASDCTPVYIGSFCGACWCPWTAINAADLMKYQAEAQAKQAGVTPPACFCPADMPSCVQGQCKGSLQ